MNTDILWLVPIAYAIHMLEEGYGNRFVYWTKKYTWLFTSQFTTKRFLIGNTAFMAYVLASVLLATTRQESWALVLGLSAAAWVFSNFLFHVVVTLVSGVYSPGVVTASMLYFPTFFYVYWSFWQASALTPSVVLSSVATGFAVMYLPFLNAMRVARKERTMASQSQQKS